MKLDELGKFTRGVDRAALAENPQKLQAHLRSLGIDPDNFYQELEMSSRYVDTHRDVSYSNSMVQLHSHSFYELIYCRNTCGVEYLVGSERYRLQKGDVILVPPGVSHRPMLPESMTEPYKRDVLWISVEFFDKLRESFQDQRLYESTGTRLIRTAGTQWENMGELFRLGVLEAERQDVGWEAAVTANTLMLLIQLRRAVIDKNARPLKAEKPELLDQVLAYIEENLDKKITLADVAHRFYVSESTITQTFRRKLTVSFYRCVTQRRLIAAKTLIQTGIRLEEVGERVGFTDYSAFYRAFKQEYGISPRQYRKLQEAAE